jgi:hypothetical protein
MGVKVVGSAVLVGVMAVASLVAHHSVTEIYDEGQTVTIVGTVERVVDRNASPVCRDRGEAGCQ